MDIQLKKGFLEYCVLGALYQTDSYGYQIIKDISPCIEISESTLYPILKRLEASACVETYSVEHNSRLQQILPHHPEGARARTGISLNDWQQLLRFTTLEGRDHE